MEMETEMVEVNGCEYLTTDSAIIYCDETEQYELTHNTVEAYGEDGDKYRCLTENCVRYNRQWYHEDYLSDNGLCLMNNGNIESEGDVYLHSDGDYYYESEYDDDDDEDLFEYHSQDRVCLAETDAPFTIGFEIEKAKMPDFRFDKYDMYENGFIMEQDGSVSYGFELVTPTFNLFDEGLESKLKYIEKFCDVSDVRNCGGHIHFGVNGLRGIDTLRKVQGWLPLIYGMYRGRTKNSYCSTYSVAKLMSYQERTQSVRILDNHVEFRVFSAVPSFDTLIWRLGFMRILARHMELTFEQVLIDAMNPETDLGKHLKIVYSDDSRFFKMLESAVGFYANLESGDITDMKAIIAETKRQKSLN